DGSGNLERRYAVALRFQTFLPGSCPSPKDGFFAHPYAPLPCYRHEFCSYKIAAGFDLSASLQGPEQLTGPYCSKFASVERFGRGYLRRMQQAGKLFLRAGAESSAGRKFAPSCHGRRQMLERTGEKCAI